MTEISSPIKIIMISDLDNWILGEISKQFSRLLKDHFEIKVLVTSSKSFRKDFRKIQGQYDVVHFLSPWDFFAHSNVITKPCVVNVWHVVDWGSFTPYFPRMDTICVGSNQWWNQVNEQAPETIPIQRMPYGLDTNLFQRNFNSRWNFLLNKNLPENTIVIGFAGAASSNQSDRKGLDRLFGALQLLRSKLKVPVIMRMIGRGWTSDIIPHELSAIIDLQNFIPAEELPNYYSSLDYYLCPSRFEGVPYPVLEAMSCQTLVISTPVGVVPETIKNGMNGFVLDHDNFVEETVGLIEKTASELDNRQKYGENARQTIVEKFDWEHVIDADIFLEIYKGAITHYYSRPKLHRLFYKLNALIRRR